MIVAWPQGDEVPGPLHRIGGYWPTVEDIEIAADLLELDVIVPPKSQHGFYMVPEQHCERCSAPRWGDDEEYASDLLHEHEVEKCIGEGGHFWPLIESQTDERNADAD